MSSDWKSLLNSAGSRLEARWDELRVKVKEELGWLDPVTIVPFRGHGDATRLRLKGRVLEEGGLGRRSADDGFWTTLSEMFQRFESDEVAGARVRATFGDRQVEVVSDEEGYIEVAFDRLDLEPEPPPGEQWREVALDLLAPLRGGQERTTITGLVLTPPASAAFGVISDVDDTIMQTGATSLISNLRTTLLNSPEARVPFKGVRSFYEALQAGAGGGGANPIFYVSSSPWNLYDLLERFKAHNGIPLGPLFLRDLGWDRTKFIKGTHGEHKIGTIDRLLAFYDHLPFILIGDSGQHDAKIYREIVHRRPGRIRAVYIRDVTRGAHDEEIRTLFAEVQGEPTEVVVSPDLRRAAEHAASHGWIRPGAVAEVAAQVTAEERAEARGETG